MSEETKLRACPFCPDGEAAMVLWGKSRCYIVLCQSCYAQTAIHLTQAKANAAWNRRAIDGVVEEIEAMVDQWQQFTNRESCANDLSPLIARLKEKTK